MSTIKYVEICCKWQQITCIFIVLQCSNIFTPLSRIVLSNFLAQIITGIILLAIVVNIQSIVPAHAH